MLYYKNIINKIFKYIILILYLNICNSYSSINTNNNNNNNNNKIKIFHRGNGDEIDTLDPQKASDGISYNIINDLYEGLMTYDINGKLIYGQAESHSVSTDLKTYKFILKNNLQWSNNIPITANDFVTAIKRALDPNTNSMNSDLLLPIKNSNKKNLDKLAVKALDNKTIIIELERPTPYFLDLLAHPVTMPVYIDKKTNKVDYFVSNGAFKLDKWIINSYLSIIKNNNYINNNSVKLDQVIFYPISNLSTELKKYRAHELDYTRTIPPTEYNFIKNNLKQELFIAPLIGTYSYEFNIENKLFKNNKNLRKALSLAIDKNIIANKIVNSEQSYTDNFIPTYINNYNSVELTQTIPPYWSPTSATNLDPVVKPRDDAELRKLYTDKFRLEQAHYYYNKSGYSRNNPPKIKILYNTGEHHKSIAIAIASMWKKEFNITTELVNQEWKVFLATLRQAKDTEFTRRSWMALYNDPYSFLELFISDNPLNTSNYKNLEYDNLIKQANNEKDLNIRSKLLKQAENIIIEDAIIVPIYHYSAMHLVKPNIKNFHVNAMNMTFDKYIDKL